ncbi:MAG: TIGR00282 family metallophosphoesterase [Spirochaetales bacterium]|jgi:metallophosphoesterase (TIGR00282 family)|nr:TIGR00282 family metallophosphoesterase [Spirochaetales bacterium]
MVLTKSVRALILGDLVGQAGCRALFLALPGLVKKYSADLVVVNGENAAGGFGLTPEIVQTLFSTGVHVITSGNHIWQQKDILPLLDSQDRLLRPHNYPRGVPGHGFCCVELRGVKAAVINLEGRVRMNNLVCPFTCAKDILRRLRQQTHIIFVDFHAEEPEEKEALGLYLDGEVSAVFGTHTHVATADERILPGGTAYITDIGMSGPEGSVIGFPPEPAVRRVLTQIPIKSEALDAPALICGIVVEVDGESGKALSIERVAARAVV